MENARNGQYKCYVHLLIPFFLYSNKARNIDRVVYMLSPFWSWQILSILQILLFLSRSSFTWRYTECSVDSAAVKPTYITQFHLTIYRVFCWQRSCEAHLYHTVSPDDIQGVLLRAQLWSPLTSCGSAELAGRVILLPSKRLKRKECLYLFVCC